MRNESMLSEVLKQMFSTALAKNVLRYTAVDSSDKNRICIKLCHPRQQNTNYEKPYQNPVLENPTF